MITSDGLIAILGVTVAVLVGGFSWYQTQIYVPKQIKITQQDYANLLEAFLNLQIDLAWHKYTLAQHGIEIPPVPDYMRPKRENLSQINVNVSQVGSNAKVGQTSVGNENTQETK